ncbi:unnamed protein product [Brassica oleracea]|uniref:Uncharacterized protein n=2 Tax=Brassica oleracea TaxID=3712 RepID=A0A0D3DIB1_BRAOL|nr:PREDICTED: uncharacterized protein LOC106304760 [Brassica oleracea var. oleracea]VDD41158.1 unnamed protein product [Brassica oleracea]
MESRNSSSPLTLHGIDSSSSSTPQSSTAKPSSSYPLLSSRVLQELCRWRRWSHRQPRKGGYGLFVLESDNERFSRSVSTRLGKDALFGHIIFSTTPQEHYFDSPIHLMLPLHDGGGGGGGGSNIKKRSSL